MQLLHQAVGLGGLLLLLAWLASENRRAIAWRPVVAGLALGFVLAAALLKLPPLQRALDALNDAANQLAVAAGSLLGKKVVLNELLAYLDVARMPPEALAPRSRLLLTYAMCGFANFGSLGIMLGGMGAMVAPQRRGEVAQLGLKSIGAGLLATCITAAMVGLLV